MLKRGSKGWTIWNIVEAILLVVVGVLCIVYNGNSDLHKWILIVLGIFVIVDAACRLLFDVLGVFKTPAGTLVSTNYAVVFAGALEMAFGIALIMIGNSDSAQHDVIFSFIGNFVGIVLIAVGALVAIYAIVFMIRKAQSVGLSIVQIIAAAMFITLGILSIVFLTNKENTMKVALITLGIILMIAGICLLAGTIMVLKANHDVKKQETAAKKNSEAKSQEDANKNDGSVVEAEANDSPKQIENSEKKD
jgi:hypothetical protein